MENQTTPLFNKGNTVGHLVLPGRKFVVIDVNFGYGEVLYRLEPADGETNPFADYQRELCIRPC